jgi:hypothetical protein
MNCFEARKEFVSFWRRTMKPEDRAAFNAHLRGCARCDRSFRIFALSALVLHSESKADAASAERRTVVAQRPLASPAVMRVLPSRKLVADRPWRAMSAAFAMAAAAAIAVYVASTPRITFEDAIAAESPNIELTSYAEPEAVFGQELLGQDASLQDPVFEDPAASTNNGLAG